MKSREELLKQENIAEQKALKKCVDYNQITFNKLILIQINFILEFILSDGTTKLLGFDAFIVEKSKVLCLKAKNFFNGNISSSDLDLLCTEAYRMLSSVEETDNKNRALAEIVWSCMYPEGEENYPHDIKIDQSMEVYFDLLFQIGSGLCASFREYAIKNW